MTSEARRRSADPANAVPRSDRRKLPVPAPWQGPVIEAMGRLAEETGVPVAAIAPTRVEPLEWRDEAGALHAGLAIWLLARAETYRYRADLASGAVLPDAV